MFINICNIIHKQFHNEKEDSDNFLTLQTKYWKYFSVFSKSCIGIIK